MGGGFTLVFDRIWIMIFCWCDPLWTDSVQSGRMHSNYLWVISMKNHVGKTE